MGSRCSQSSPAMVLMPMMLVGGDSARGKGEQREGSGMELHGGEQQEQSLCRENKRNADVANESRWRVVGGR